MDQVPDHVLLIILRQLPLRDLLRSAGVCRRFHDFSDLIVRTELIDLPLYLPDLARLPPEILRYILHWRHDRLRTVRLPGPSSSSSMVNDACAANVEHQLSAIKWCQQLCEFRLEQLSCLDLGGASLGGALVEKLLRSCPSLSSFSWTAPDPNGFLIPAPMPRLKSIDLPRLYVKDALLDSLARHCPSLERLRANANFRLRSTACLDKLCGACPKLRSLRLQPGRSSVDAGNYVVPLLLDPPRLTEHFRQFWQLTNLRHLTLPFAGGLFDDQALERLAVAFPLLHTLQFGDAQLTSDGLEHLCRLAHLRHLSMTQTRGNVSRGLRRLARLQKLIKLNLADTTVSIKTLLEILTQCTKLNYLNLIETTNISRAHRSTPKLNENNLIDLIDAYQRLPEASDTLYLVISDQEILRSAAIERAILGLQTQTGRTLTLLPRDSPDTIDNW